MVTVLPSDTPMRQVNEEKDIESLVVAWDDQGVGIVTEKDVVRRVVAEKLCYETQVLEIMKPLLPIHGD